MNELHRRLAALLALIALLAFVSGAGLAAPSVLPALLLLAWAAVARPRFTMHRHFETLWRTAALLLAARAGLLVLTGSGDPVLPMVDLLLLLLCAESLRRRDGGGDARHFALTFALLIASTAYRPGALFGVFFVAYVMVGVLVLVLAHLSREARSTNRTLPAPPASYLARVARLSTIVLVVSGLTFVLFPRVPQGWAARATTPVARAIVGFSDRVSIGEHGTRIEANPEVVLRIEFPDGVPADLTSLHWRGRGYVHFDGRTWSRGEGVPPRMPREADLWQGSATQQIIYARQLPDANVLFGLHAVIDVTPLSRIRPLLTRNGDWLYAGEADPVYRVRSRHTAPDAAHLRGASRDMPPTVFAYLQLPVLGSRVLALADSLRGGAPAQYDHVRAVENYLRDFAYTLELPRTRREASLEHFLFERRAGHCEYFSTAMAILLRAGGVPARNVNGFLGGDWNEFGRHLTVTQNNAHSWVEVFFPGYGWVAFDPTPPAAAAIIAGGAGGIGVLRRFLQGVDHRWGKWILGYDASRQTALLQRASDALRMPGATSADRRIVRPRAWLVLLGAALVLLAWRIGHARKRVALAPAARIYADVRRAYEGVGLPPAQSLPPLAFARAVRDMAGGEATQRVVRTYVDVRFGGAVLQRDEIERMRDDAAAARSALAAASRRARLSRRADP